MSIVLAVVAAELFVVVSTVQIVFVVVTAVVAVVEIIKLTVVVFGLPFVSELLLALLDDELQLMVFVVEPSTSELKVYLLLRLRLRKHYRYEELLSLSTLSGELEHLQLRTK